MKIAVNTTRIKGHKHIFDSADSHNKKRKAALLIFTATMVSSSVPVSELDCSTRLRDVQAWVADLRLWTRSLCPPAKELSRGLQPKSRSIPQPLQQTLSRFNELQFPPATNPDPETNRSTLLLWVAHLLTAGLTRQSLSWILHFALHFMKANSFHLPTPSPLPQTQALKVI